MGIRSPTCIKDIQRLARRVATLNRFISRSLEKYDFFFTTLHKSKDIEWTLAYKEELQKFKKYLTSPPFLSKPKDGEQLFIYLAISKTTISVVQKTGSLLHK